MPADPAVDFPGFPLEATVTRPITQLEKLAQIERKEDAPQWAWRPATWAVLGLNLLLAIGLALATARIGRLAAEDRRDAEDSGTSGDGGGPADPQPGPAPEPVVTA
jgi:hypothetical protein